MYTYKIYIFIDVKDIVIKYYKLYISTFLKKENKFKMFIFPSYTIF